ncbi:MAG TPA: TonB-dependent receptor [Terriglobales bacterium]|nr:TonB-dependent receptor [Terriglobales bacterium]
MRLFLLALVVALLFVLPGAAQTVTGTLSGRVVDAQGAVIPNTGVSMRGEDTGLVRETKTNAEGFYTFSFVPLGKYSITAKATGFTTVKKTGVLVTLNTTTTSDFSLKPATVAETVEVTGEAPLIETTGSDVKDTFDTRTIQDRPLPSRNIMTLAETVPGFQNNPVSGQNNPTASSGSSANFNGIGTRGTTFQVNGVNNDDSSENQHRQNVNIDSIAEVQVLTNNYSAEFGRGYGAVMLVQTKQGTNLFHGTAFLYEINSPLGFANNYYANFNKTPIASWRRHDYGGTIGGPVLSNKLFFFGSYEGVRNGGGRQSTYSVLLPSERAPNALVTNPDDRAFIQSIIDRFPNAAPNSPNLCPGSSTVKGSIDGLNYTKTPPCRVYTMPIKYSYPSEDLSGRADWNINDRNTFSSRYQWSRQETNPGTDWILGQAVAYHNTQQNVGLTLTHTFSNYQTGEFRFAIGRRATLANIMAGNDTPIFRFGGTYGSIIGNAGNFPILRYQTDYQYVYNHSYEVNTKLRLRFGSDVRISQLNDFSDNYTRGYWSMGGPGWVQTAAGDNFEYRDGYYNFLRGVMVGGSFTKGYGPARLGNRLKEFNFYAQADYRVMPSLTLNLGVRNEYVRAPREVDNLVDYGYGDINGFEPRIGFAYSPQFKEGVLGRLTGGPDQTVVRGGFGLFHGRWFQSAFSQGGASIRFNPPNGAYMGFTMTSGTSIADPTGGFTFQPGPPTGRISPVAVDPNLTLPYAEQWNLMVQRQLPAQTGLSIAYVGNRGIGLPFMNILNRAQFPFVAPPVNQWSPTDQANGTAARWAGVSFDCIDPNLSSTTPISPSPGHQCISLSQTYANYRRPDARYGGITQIKNGSWSYYHALQVLVTKRPTHGINFQAAYTFSKALDTGSEFTYMGVDSNTPYLQNDSAASMKGYSVFDTPHRFTITYGYDFPFFKTQQGVLGRILGGWTWSGTTLLASGTPFTITAGSYDLNADGVANDRPNVLDASVYGRSIDNGRYVPGTRTTYSQSQVPADAFFPNYTMTVNSFGAAFNPGINNKNNEYRNGFRAAGRNNFDMAITKNLKISEGHSLVLRLDAYNVFNHPQFGYPTQAVTSTTFGQISSQFDSRGFFTDGFGGARFLQAAIRYRF